jgi:hypothetical protein
VPRADLDGILADGKTKGPAAAVAPAVPADARAELEQALSRAQRLLGRRSATRRAELAVGLQDLADAVTAFLGVLADDARDAETTEATENG